MCVMAPLGLSMPSSIRVAQRNLTCKLASPSIQPSSRPITAAGAVTARSQSASAMAVAPQSSAHLVASHVCAVSAAAHTASPAGKLMTPMSDSLKRQGASADVLAVLEAFQVWAGVLKMTC
jgi:hypothetical protein